MRIFFYISLDRDESSSIYTLILMQTAHPGGPADKEECTHFASRG